MALIINKRQYYWRATFVKKKAQGSLQKYTNFIFWRFITQDILVSTIFFTMATGVNVSKILISLLPVKGEYF